MLPIYISELYVCTSESPVSVIQWLKTHAWVREKGRKRRGYECIQITRCTPIAVTLHFVVSMLFVFVSPSLTCRRWHGQECEPSPDGQTEPAGGQDDWPQGAATDGWERRGERRGIGRRGEEGGMGEEANMLSQFSRSDHHYRKRGKRADCYGLVSVVYAYIPLFLWAGGALACITVHFTM